MARKHEIAIASETGAFEKGIKSGVVEPLEDAEKALKDLGDVSVGRDIDKDLDAAQRATKNLKDETKDTADAIEKSFRQSYKKIKDDSDDTTTAMKGGMQEFKEEANSTARESAASFDGTAESIADVFQEVAANAFAGFGPAGAAAGLAVAAIVGTALASAEAAQEKLNETRERAVDLATELYDNDGVLPLTDRVQELFTVLGREARTGTQLQSMIDQWADFGTVLEQVEKASGLIGQPLSKMKEALSGPDIKLTRDTLAEITEQFDGLAEFTPVWAPEYQALSAAKTELEGVVQQFELAEKLNTPEVLNAKRVDDLAQAWANAGVKVEDYFSKGEDGATTFDVGKYIADMEAQVATANEVKADILTVPPSIAAEAERIWTEQGVDAADAYVDGYQSADAGTKAKLEGLAGAQGQAAGSRAAKGFVEAANAGVNTFKPPVFDVAIRPWFDQAAMDRTLAAIRERANRGAVTVMVNTRAGNQVF